MPPRYRPRSCRTRMPPWPSIVRMWEAAQGIQASPSTMRRALLRLGITLKKDPDRLRAGCRGVRPMACGHGEGGPPAPDFFG